MKVGQLWYTRALRGAEGTNKFQILAASGRLDDRSRPLTQAALTSCYRPTGPTLSWSVERGAVVATNRVVLDDVNANRAGIFFVHALVGPPEALPPAALGQLMGASGWQERAPEAVPDKLEPLPDIDAIGLRPAPVLDDELVEHLIAGVLRNASEHRQSALDLEPPIVAALAARLGELLPTRREALGFCSQPDDEQVDRYAIVAGRPRSPRFRQIDPDAEVDDDGRAVARLLVAARAGDERARGVVRDVDGFSRELSHLAAGLYLWARVDRRPGRSDSVSSSEALRFVGSQPGLVAALLAGEGRWAVAEGIADGTEGVGPLVAVAHRIGAFDSALEPTGELLDRLPPATASARVIDLASSNGDAAGRLAVRLVERWAERGLLGEVPGRERAGLLRVLAVHNPRLRTVPALLVDDRSAPLIAAADVLPLAWRARALARHHGVISDDVIGSALSRSWELARAVSTELGEGSPAFLGPALRTLPPDTALDVISVLERTSADAWIGRWTADALARLRPKDRIETATRLVRTTRRGLLAEAGELIVQALEEGVVGALASRRALPALADLVGVFSAVEGPSPRVHSWLVICGAAREMHSYDRTGAPWVAATAAMRLDPPSRVAAVVAVLGTVHDRVLVWEEWFAAVASVRGATTELDEPFWRLLIHSTWSLPRQVRSSHETATSVRCRVALNLASEIIEGTLAKTELKSRTVVGFLDDLTSAELRHLELCVDVVDPPELRPALAKLLKSGSRR
ncbi:MAG TPA: hypothetical protein VF228_20460 [Iamia sp.]